MVYSIQWLKESFEKLEWDDKKYRVHIRLINNMEARIKKEEIVQIYPKNLFRDDGEIIFYTFTNKYIYTTKADNGNDKLTFNKIMKIKDIAILEMTEGNEYEPTTLKIRFYNGEEIAFDSSVDANEGHMRSFNETINKITNLLLEV